MLHRLLADLPVEQEVAVKGAQAGDDAGLGSGCESKPGQISHKMTQGFGCKATRIVGSADEKGPLAQAIQIVPVGFACIARQAAFELQPGEKAFLQLIEDGRLAQGIRSVSRPFRMVRSLSRCTKATTCMSAGLKLPAGL